MKMRIALFVVFALVSVTALRAETQQAQPASPTATHTARPGEKAFVPAAGVFGDATNGFKPSVPPCQPGQGAQSFSSALGQGLGGVSGY